MKLFQNDLDATIVRYHIIQSARLYRNEIAIAAVDHTVPRTIAAQAADELLNISGIMTSFVLYPDGDVSSSPRAQSARATCRSCLKSWAAAETRPRQARRSETSPCARCSRNLLLPSTSSMNRKLLILTAERSLSL